MEPQESYAPVNQSSDRLVLLLLGIKRGDDGAFKEFFLMMQPGIYKFLYRYLCDRNAAEDLTQETFVKFWMHREDLDPNFSPKSYLYKIARNLALNHISRSNTVNNFVLTKKDYVSLLINPEENFDKYFLLDEFQKAVNDLPERCRATFILCKYEGFKYSEIAEILNVSIQTVKNQMNKAISVLKKLLSSHLS